METKLKFQATIPFSDHAYPETAAGITNTDTSVTPAGIHLIGHGAPEFAGLKLTPAGSRIDSLMDTVNLILGTAE